MPECRYCQETKPAESFNIDRSLRSGRRARCKSCDAAFMAAYRRGVRRDPARWAADNLPKIRKRAQERGIPFSITVKDVLVPEACPITGVKFVFGGGAQNPAMPSIDRIIPSLGYVPGNVAVISLAANRIKSDCTDPAVFRRVADWLEEQIRIAQAAEFIGAVMDCMDGGE